MSRSPNVHRVDLDIPDWPEIDDQLTSDIADSVDLGVAARLCAEQVVAPFPGWNFYAYCWYADGQFYAAVYRHHHRVVTLAATTPELIKDGVMCFGAY